MVSILSLYAALCSVLLPAKTWYRPDEPVMVTIDHDTPVRIVLRDFLGRPIDTQAQTLVQGQSRIDLKALFPAALEGTFVVYAIPEGARPGEFAGTPLVWEIRTDERIGAAPGPVVHKVSPLVTALIETDAGSLKLAFYYDVAPDTVANFIDLSMGGYYDGIIFHRIVPGFVIQAGDPRGDGTGGPGYTINAEFNNRQHLEGVISMAREGDPLERGGATPRREFADSAASQFFLCLDPKRTSRLDGKYTAFGRLVEGLDVMHAIAKAPLSDAATGKPVNAPRITSIRIEAVTYPNDPYPTLLQDQADTKNDPTTLPTP